MREISEAQEISSKYLHALLSSLKSAGLVRSIRGSGGGYSLARVPGDIQLLEIVTALEGPIELVDCVSEATLCDRSPTCAAHEIWVRVSRAIQAELDGVTLEEVAARQAKLEE